MKTRIGKVISVEPRDGDHLPDSLPEYNIVVEFIIHQAFIGIPDPVHGLPKVGDEIEIADHESSAKVFN